MLKDEVKSSTIEIAPLDYRNQEQVHAVAGLHKELLSDSPIPQLGYQFMTEFYYTKLVEAGLIGCDLAKCDGKYVAFLVYTKYPFTFMEEGKRRYFLYLLFLFFKILILRPSRIKTILKVIRLNQKRQFKKDGDKVGEMVSFGVLEPYRNLRDKITGLRIPDLLFRGVIAYFKKEGFERILGEVAEGNSPALLFWHSQGAVIKEHNWGKEKNYLVSIEL